MRISLIGQKNKGFNHGYTEIKKRSREVFQDENWADELDMYLENKGYEVAHILDGLDPVDIVAVRDDIIYVVYLSRPDLPADDPESYGFYQI